MPKTKINPDDILGKMPSLDDMRRMSGRMGEIMDNEPARAPAVSDAHLEAALSFVRRSMKLYGTLVPPRDIRFSAITKLCPKCDEEKLVLPDFGLRTREDGVIDAQPWCNKCRSTRAFRK